LLIFDCMESGGTSWCKRFFLFLLFVLTFAANSFAAVDIHSLPKPTGYVSDLAQVINDTDKSKLEEFCTKVEQQLGVQFALVTIDTIGDQPIRDFALDLFRQWGVGDRKTNQGVLLLLAIKDHKSDIETGRGIEPYLTDGFSGGTLRSMRPELRAGDYGAALQTAAREMANQIAQGKNIAFSNDQLPTRDVQPRNTRQGSRGGIPFPLIIVGIFFLLWLFGRGGRRGGGMRGGGSGGFWTGMLINSMLNSGGRRSGSDWGGGGGFGGDSGGGGGFGGFGGGDAGGGGASSDW
jgi:uncharacterized protein